MMTAPIVSEAALRQHIDAWLSAERRSSRTLLVRAQPTWSGHATMVLRDRSVRVVEGVSGLAALDAMRSAADDEVIVVLTALSERELGDAVVLDAHRQRVSTLDEWGMVPGLFGARDQNVPKHVHDLGPWLPGLLVSLQPTRGYAPAPGAVLTPEHVVRSLIASLLSLSRLGDLDLVAVLAPLDDVGIRARLRDLTPDAREGLVLAASDQIGAHVGLALRAAINGGNISTIAVGLIVAELWQPGPASADAEVGAARVRIERYIGTGVTAEAARRYGEAARRTAQRLLTGTHGRSVLEQAEALSDELGWHTGAAASDFLPAGLQARIKTLATAIEAAAALPSVVAAAEVDTAFDAVRQHQAASILATSMPAIGMAVRLVRWLNVPDFAPGSFPDAVHQYAISGGWAERALGDIWDGGHTAALAEAFGKLAHAVQAALRAQDAAAAALLTGQPFADENALAIEQVLSKIVVPLSADRPVLLIVLDGMSVATAIELAAEIPGLGWSELVRASHTNRSAAVAVLPTMTTFSRTTLFAGELLAGDQQTEKVKFAAVVGGVVFHKDDLRSDAGHALPPTVTDALRDPSNKIVGVVLNTIDDALATAEVDSLRWSLNQIANLSALLSAAHDAHRVVVLTSDHGHVVERGSDLRSTAGASARYRDSSTGTARPDEVLVSGPRVLTSGGESVLAVSDGVRYAAKRAGYHGGASLAEVAIPLIVLKPSGAENPVGWVEAPPQEPTWWNEPVRPGGSSVEPPPARRKRARRTELAGPTLFDALPEPPLKSVRPAASLGEQLLASTNYRDRRSSGGRHPIDDDAVLAIIEALVAGGGRAHRDTIAVAARVPATSVNGLLASLRRLLNMDGYAIIEVDADQVTVTLDVNLLREQFELGGR